MERVLVGMWVSKQWVGKVSAVEAVSLESFFVEVECYSVPKARSFSLGVERDLLSQTHLKQEQEVRLSPGWRNDSPRQRSDWVDTD